MGRKHELSAGLLIGGKKVKEEASRVALLNVLIATPGQEHLLPNYNIIDAFSVLK